MMKLSQKSKPKTFIDLQYAFTRYIRDPENQPAPAGVDAQGIEIYRDLVYRNTENMLGNLFPMLRKITLDDRWESMVRGFFRQHQSHNPLFTNLPQEFLRYLQDERDVDDDPSFITELAHYERVDYAISIDVREIEYEGIDPEGDLLKGIPVLSPLAWSLSYRYPVHTISPKNQPSQPPSDPTYIIVYRDRKYKVGFIELNPVSARLVELIKDDNNVTGGKLLETIADELKHPDPEVVVKGGLEIMETMRKKNVLLGVKKME
ncbi:MAG: putative DNA-binding domain-containing protein [Gammaproteobacteria bacterium]